LQKVARESIWNQLKEKVQEEEKAEAAGENDERKEMGRP